MKILISQEDLNLCKYLKKGLRESGFQVEIANDDEETMDLLNEMDFDLVLMESKSDAIDGIKIIQELKKTNKDIGVIFLSDVDDVDLKVQGLDLGGDDYIVKPFNFRELIARIRAVLRRENNSSDNILSAKDLTLNLLNREVKRNGRTIELTLKEFNLLEYLLRNKNLVLTRTVIKEKVWNIDFLNDTNIVDVYITHLREKMDKTFEDKLIYTVRGVGYILKD
ncbi:winged helix-turn-helix domain-containing protein [Cetobacterium sp. SF1]|uniref:winged helix-turn-helix domain-containing protein n=1 Tax=unclassified Cetobacterium TaxID=2630983 RepID=UPI003CE80B2A